jgi:hypothetical protein
MFGLGLIELGLIALVFWLGVRKHRGEPVGGAFAVAVVALMVASIAPVAGILASRSAMVSAEVATVAQRALGAPLRVEAAQIPASLPLLVVALFVVLVVVALARSGRAGATIVCVLLALGGLGLLRYLRGQVAPLGPVAQVSPPVFVSPFEPRIDLGDDVGKWDEQHAEQPKAEWDAERIRANDEAYGSGGAEAKRIEFLEKGQQENDADRRKALESALKQARDEWVSTQQSARDAAKQAASEFERITKEFQRLAGMKAALDSKLSAEESFVMDAPERPERPERPEAPEQPEMPEMPEGSAAGPTAVAARPAWIASPPASDSRNRRAVLSTDPYFTLDSLEAAAESQLRAWLEGALAESVGRPPAPGSLAGLGYAELRSQFVRSSYDESRSSSAGDATIRHQLVELPEVIPAHFVDLVHRSGRRERVAGVAAIGGSVVATLALLYGLLGIGVCKNPRLGPKAPGSTGG